MWAARSPTRPRTAATPRMPSTWWCRRCPATASPASRPRAAWAPPRARSPGRGGGDAARIASAWAERMDRLGYSRYVAQGGDQGAGVTDAMGRLAPDGLLGLHFNFLSAAPRELLMAALNIRLAFSMED